MTSPSVERASISNQADRDDQLRYKGERNIMKLGWHIKPDRLE